MFQKEEYFFFLIVPRIDVIKNIFHFSHINLFDKEKILNRKAKKFNNVTINDTNNPICHHPEKSIIDLYHFKNKERKAYIVD